jgi:hypothetical protein
MAGVFHADGHVVEPGLVFLGYGDEKLGNPRRKSLAEVAQADRYGTSYGIVGG